MTAQNLVDYTRFLMAETVSGRFTDADLITAAHVASYDLMTRIQWPDGTLTVTTSANQEYTLPPVLEILRVDINGQRLIPTTLSRLEGVSYGLFDQTGVGNVPKWTLATAKTYPVANSNLGYPTTAGSLPYNPLQRPVYYMRGGNMGIVPPPTAGQTLTIQIIPVPTDLVIGTDFSLFP